MLTDEEFSRLLDADEEALVEELGEVLRQGPELPADFARHTARAIEERFRSLPRWQRAAHRLESVMGAPVWSARALPFTGVLGAALTAGVFSPTLLACLGVLLAHFCGTWFLVGRVLPGPKQPLPFAQWLNLSYYFVPLTAAASTGVFCGCVIWVLGTLSLSFRRTSLHPTFLSWGAGLAVFLYLLSAFIPTWRAMQRQALGKPLRCLVGQLLHGLWLGLLFQALALALPGFALSSAQAWAMAIVPALVVTLLISLRPVDEGAPASLGPTLRKTARSLVLGGMPIAAILVTVYQMNLTRKLENPEGYRALVAELEGWEKAEKSIPPQQNGWLEVKPYLLRPEDPKVTPRLRAGSKVYAFLSDDQSVTPAAYQEARRDFVAVLPRVRSALNKQRFSVVATQGCSFQSLIPNFIACRAVSQGLTGLAMEATKAGKTAETLDYMLLNLKWSRAFSDGLLISEMIAIAQLKVALEPVERWLLEAHPTTEQLRQMLVALRTARPSPGEFATSMKREIYAADRFFRLILEDYAQARTIMDGQDNGAERLLFMLVTKSYWQSERNTYLNLQLDGLSRWRELGRPDDTDPSERLPFFLSARFVPNVHRAQLQFMALLTRLYALETATALELYHREHGVYPQHLEELVKVGYLDRLPVDAIHPHRWSRKPPLKYARTERGYELISESVLYRSLELKQRQTYGHDGNYALEKGPKM